MIKADLDRQYLLMSFMKYKEYKDWKILILSDIVFVVTQIKLITLSYNIIYIIDNRYNDKVTKMEGKYN